MVHSEMSRHSSASRTAKMHELAQVQLAGLVSAAEQACEIKSRKEYTRAVWPKHFAAEIVVPVTCRVHGQVQSSELILSPAETAAVTASIAASLEPYDLEVTSCRLEWTGYEAEGVSPHHGWNAIVGVR